MIEIKRDEKKGKIWSHMRSKWLVEKPEETVRQKYVLVLVNEYGFSFEQMDEEIPVTERGAAQVRADILIWRSPEEKRNRATS